MKQCHQISNKLSTCFYKYECWIPRTNYQRDQQAPHLLVFQTRMGRSARKTPDGAKPKVARSMQETSQTVTCKKSSKTTFSLLILSSVNYSQNINLVGKVNSRMYCPRYIFLCAFSTDISLHPEQFPFTVYNKVWENWRCCLCQTLPW